MPSHTERKIVRSISTNTTLTHPKSYKEICEVSDSISETSYGIQSDMVIPKESKSSQTTKSIRFNSYSNDYSIYNDNKVIMNYLPKQFMEIDHPQPQAMVNLTQVLMQLIINCITKFTTN